MTKPKAKSEKSFREARREITSSVSASTLGTIFGMSTETVREKIGHLNPTAEYNGSPLYALRDAAPYLVTPVGIDIEKIVRQLKPSQLPTALQKDFWSSQKIRLQYMQEAGDLWHTDAVQEVIGKLFRTVRQRALLFADTLDRQTALTQEQRQVAQGMMDAMLDDLHKEITEHFKNYDPDAERDELFEEGAQAAGLSTMLTDPNGGL